MEDIVVIGAGGFAREVKFLIGEINQPEPKFRFAGYLLSDMSYGSERDSADELLGDFSWLGRRAAAPISIAIGIGDPGARLALSRRLRAAHPSARFPALVHPSVIYDRSSCRIGEGVIVCAGTILTVNVEVREFAVLNLACTVGHEASIGAGCVLNPTVNVSGGVVLGEGVLVGTGAQILQYLTVGAGAKVGAGACVTKDVPAGVTVVGVPAKPLVARDPG